MFRRHAVWYDSVLCGRAVYCVLVWCNVWQGGVFFAGGR